MLNETSNGIVVSVDPMFMNDKSSALESKYSFCYNVIFENVNTYPVQIVERHLILTDTKGCRSFVDTVGLVDNYQPVIQKNSVYRYAGSCIFSTDIATIHGCYIGVNILDGQRFKIGIPRFNLIPYFKLN